MKKALIFLLALVLLLSTAACGKVEPGETEKETPEATTAQTSSPSVSLPASVDNPVTGIYIYRQTADGNFYQLEAYPNSGDTAWVTYVADIKKAATMDLAAMNYLTAAIADSGLADFNGTNLFTDGPTSTSMYISYEDGSVIAASFNGQALPEDFMAAYYKLENSFKELMQDIPEYVPAPMIMGEPNETDLEEILDIFEASGIDYPDAFAISDAPADETFGPAVGLDETEGILRGTVCQPLMSSHPFIMVIVTVEKTSQLDTVRRDFTDNPDWVRWVCVSADSAVVAEKGNSVIFLMANSSDTDTFSPAINACGWENSKTIHR